MKKSMLLFIILIILLTWVCDPDPGAPSTGEIPIPENGLINYEEEFLISWDFIKESRIIIHLMRDDILVANIAENIDNQGSFTWTPGAELVGAGYTIQMVALSPYNELLADAASPPFRITNPNWEDLGYVNTPAEEAPWGPIIDIDKDGMPLVLFNHMAITPMAEDESDKWKNHLNLKKWNATGWVDMDYISEYQSNYYSLACRSDGSPVVFYTEGLNNGSHFVQWQPGAEAGGAWDRSAPPLIEDRSEAETLENFTYAFGLSLALDRNDNPVIAYYFIEPEEPLIDQIEFILDSPELDLRNRLENVNFNIVLRVRHRQGEEWVAYGDDGDQVGDLSFFKQMVAPIISEYLGGAEVELPHFTSLVFDDNNKPYLAISDYNSDGLVRVFTMEGNSWQLLKSEQSGDFASSGSATSPQLVIDHQDRPIIAYYQNVLQQIVVKRWDGSQWENLNFPAYSGDIDISSRIKSRVSIAVTGNGQVVVACEDGVKMYDGSKWINLGYPNFPCRGTGYWNGWLAAGDSEIALVYQENELDRVEGNTIRAVLLKLP